MRIEVTLRDSDGHPIEAVGQLVHGSEGDVSYSETDSHGRLLFNEVSECQGLMIKIYDGFWTLLLDPNRLPDVIECPPLPKSAATMWWHRALGLKTPNSEAGKGIRVGVVDTAFASGEGLEHAVVVDLAGNTAVGELGKEPPHGEQVCRLIGHRVKEAERFGGIAPGADLICVNSDVGYGYLNTAVATSAILQLADDYKCDLINLSAGRREPTPGLEQVIREARQYGALCLVAAGNEPHDQVSFPARYRECIGVGAIGLKEWGPPHSLSHAYSKVATNVGALKGDGPDQLLYHHPKSAYGEGLDVVAPGVGLVIYRGTQPVADLYGTSFACPLVTGLLAELLGHSSEYRALSRGPQRAAFAERALRAVCCRLGIGLDREGEGLPRLPP